MTTETEPKKQKARWSGRIVGELIRAKVMECAAAVGGLRDECHRDDDAFARGWHEALDAAERAVREVKP